MSSVHLPSITGPCSPPPKPPLAPKSTFLPQLPELRPCLKGIKPTKNFAALRDINKTRKVSSERQQDQVTSCTFGSKLFILRGLGERARIEGIGSMIINQKENDYTKTAVYQEGQFVKGKLHGEGIKITFPTFPEEDPDLEDPIFSCQIGNFIDGKLNGAALVIDHSHYHLYSYNPTTKETSRKLLGDYSDFKTKLQHLLNQETRSSILKKLKLEEGKLKNLHQRLDRCAVIGLKLGEQPITPEEAQGESVLLGLPSIKQSLIKPNLEGDKQVHLEDLPVCD